MPISWKDLFDSAGIATEAGSRLLEGRVPDADAEVLARATRAGLVCLGKTHMSELAFAGLGLNPAYRGTPEGATPPNVNDPACVPGGSSSGAVASVAFGLAAAGIGSDTGGSVRVPAAWNDLVGLKTTSGRLPLEGVVPLAESFDTVGPLCRSVEDCAHLLAVMEGGAAPDLTGARLEGRRFLVLEPYVSDAAPAQASGFASGVERLAKAGARIETGTVGPIADAMGLSPVLFAAEAYGTWSEAIEAAPDRMFDRVRDRFRGGADFSGPDYVAAWRRLRDLRRAWAAETAAYDAVLLPTTANAPPDIARLMADPDFLRGGKPAVPAQHAGGQPHGALRSQPAHRRAIRRPDDAGPAHGRGTAVASRCGGGGGTGLSATSFRACSALFWTGTRASR